MRIRLLIILLAGCAIEAILHLDGKRAAQRMLVNRLTPVIWAHVQRDLLQNRLNIESYDADLTQHIWVRLWADNGRLGPTG